MKKRSSWLLILPVTVLLLAINVSMAQAGRLECVPAASCPRGQVPVGPRGPAGAVGPAGPSGLLYVRTTEFETRCAPPSTSPAPGDAEREPFCYVGSVGWPHCDTGDYTIGEGRASEGGRYFRPYEGTMLWIRYDSSAPFSGGGHWRRARIRDDLMPAYTETVSAKLQVICVDINED